MVDEHLAVGIDYHRVFPSPGGHPLGVRPYAASTITKMKMSRLGVNWMDPRSASLSVSPINWKSNGAKHSSLIGSSAIHHSKEYGVFLLQTTAIQRRAVKGETSSVYLPIMAHAVATDCSSIFAYSINTSRVLNLRNLPSLMRGKVELSSTTKKPNSFVVCGARGPRPRHPRVWKSRNKIGTISKSQKLVQCVKELSNVKEEVYGALDSFIAWELEFPLIVVKKALKTLEGEREWKRIIQVTKWMLSKGQGKTMGSYYTLLNALAEDGRLEEAEELWTKIFSANLESLPRTFFIKMISIYYTNGMNEKMFEVFADMEELSIRPDGSIIKMVGDVFQKLGMLDKYERLMKKYPPLTWEYRYYKGKRVKVRAKQPYESEKVYIRQTNEPVQEISVMVTNEAEEVVHAEQSNETGEIASP